jgi:hypothetical protein
MWHRRWTANSPAVTGACGDNLEIDGYGFACSTATWRRSRRCLVRRRTRRRWHSFRTPVMTLMSCARGGHCPQPRTRAQRCDRRLQQRLTKAAIVDAGRSGEAEKQQGRQRMVDGCLEWQGWLRLDGDNGAAVNSDPTARAPVGMARGVDETIGFGLHIG